MALTILDVRGSPAEMGAEHGRLVGPGLRTFARERLALAASGAWTGESMPLAQVLELAEACVRAHWTYSPDLAAELAALAETAGLSMAEAVVANGFTDFIDTVYAAARGAAAGGAGTASASAGYDDCTAFLVPAARAADGHGLFGQTWDMHASAADHVVALRGRPDDAPAFVALTTVGCLGMIGMNEAGVTVGINNLSGGDGRVGVTWPFVVRAALRAATLDEAVRRVVEAPLAGAHNYLLMDATGRGVNIEATSTRTELAQLEDEVLVHANHCLSPRTLEVQRQRDPGLQASSEARQASARSLLDRRGLGPQELMAVTADEEAICYPAGRHGDLATCGAVVARPATREFWAVAGRPRVSAFERVELPG